MDKKNKKVNMTHYHKPFLMRSEYFFLRNALHIKKPFFPLAVKKISQLFKKSDCIPLPQMLNWEHSLCGEVVSIIRRFLCFSLVLSMSFSSALASCGLNPSVRKVTRMISELGEITNESEAAIEAAEAAYEALEDDVRDKVTNYGDLAAAREKLDELREADKMIDLWTDFVGEWTELSTVLPAFSPIVSWFGSLVLEDGGTYVTDRVTHSWTVSEDRTQITLAREAHMNVFRCWGGCGRCSSAGARSTWPCRPCWPNGAGAMRPTLPR